MSHSYRVHAEIIKMKLLVITVVDEGFSKLHLQRPLKVGGRTGRACQGGLLTFTRDARNESKCRI